MKRAPRTQGSPVAEQPRPPRREIFDVIVQCKDEREQRALFERLVREGFVVRVITA